MAPGPGKPYDVQATDEDSATSALVPSGQRVRDVQTARGEENIMAEPSRTSISDLPSLNQYGSVPTIDAAASLQLGSHVIQASDDELSSRLDAHETENRNPPPISNRHPPNIANMPQEESRFSQNFETPVRTPAGLGAPVRDTISALPEPPTSVQRPITQRESDIYNRRGTNNQVTRGIPGNHNTFLYDRNPEQLQLNGQVTIATDGHRRELKICRHVQRPDLAEFHARLQTFQNLSSSWRKAAPVFLHQLANAGFYSLEGNNVKCFACGGELGDWDENDDPFYEHVYWLGGPDCPFVQAVWHNLQNIRLQTVESNGERMRAAATENTPRDIGFTASSQQHIHTYDKQLREMGFAPDNVRLVIQRRERAHSFESLNIDRLIEDLIKMNQH